MSARKLKTLTLAKKASIINEIENGCKKSDISKKFDIPRSTLSTILKNRAKIREAVDKGINLNRQHSKPLKYADVDSSVVKWVQVMRDKNLPLSGPLIKEKAIYIAKSLELHDFTASEGWLEKFKKRYDIVQKSMCGESADVSQETCTIWIRDMLPPILSRYHERNVFNADETGIFFKCLPNKTLTFKNEKCHGGKHSKQRITCLVAANMDGTEKLPLLIIGKSANPRCFKGVKSLPVEYFFNKNSWMTSEIFGKWLYKLDKIFERENRKVALFIDNCPAHPPNLKSKLKFIELIFFPPNTTSKVQPMDQGVIKNLKLHYRRSLLTKIIDSMEQPNVSVSLLDAIRILHKCWTLDVKESTIKNCFKHAGFGRHSLWDDEDDIPLIQLVEMASNNAIDDNMNHAFNTFIQRAGEPNLQDLCVNDYIDVDDEVATFVPTDETFLNPRDNERGEDENEDDDDDYESLPVIRPSNEEVKKALSTMKSFLDTTEGTNNKMYNNLIAIEAHFEHSAEMRKKQSTISDFFKIL